MQLTGKSSIHSALTAFTVALLGSGSAHAAEGKRFESSLLLYSEVDRVQAAEGVFNLNLPLNGSRIMNTRMTFDGLTGASPNGATPSSGIQTFTGPSGNGSTYMAKPGEIPLDNTFRDNRFSVSGSLSESLGRLTTLVIGANVSTEHDYTSLGANLGITRDFNRRNTTLSASAAFSHDLINPVGGAPVPFGVMTQGGEDDENDVEDERDFEFEDEEEGSDGGGDRSKNVYDAVFGVTQVLDRKTILRVNYSFNHSTGYLNDPYKILSIVQGPEGAAPGEPVNYIYESRPDTREKHALYAEIRRFIGGHTIDLSYRYFWDSWGVESQTIDLHYRFPLKGGHALQPHLRWYKQTGADFYRTFLTENSPMPAYGSADYRLAPFHAITAGLQYFLPIGRNMNFNIGGEYYWQAGDISPPESYGILSRVDLFPKMDAIMIRAGIGYDF